MFLIEELEMDPAVEGRYGRNAFLLACDSGNIEMVKYLAEREPQLINSVKKNNNTGLHLATWKGNMDTVLFLIEELEMDPAVKGRYGRNAFLWACDRGNIEIVKYFATVTST